MMDIRDAGVRGLPLRQDGHQSTPLEVGRQVPLGAHQDAVPVERPAHRNSLRKAAYRRAFNRDSRDGQSKIA